MEQVRYEVDGPVGRVTIDRPERHNAMSFQVMQELGEAFAAAKADESVRVVVLTGAGERAFCAGADLGGIGSNAGPARMHEARGGPAALFKALWQLGKPTIARVRGYCLAGGFGLALSCDFVVASEDSTFGAPEVDIGLWPYQITIPLIRSMPPKLALDLMLTGRKVKAAEGERMGFVSRLVPPEELDATVDELAATLAAKSAVVTRWGRNSFYRVVDMAGEEALDYLHAMLTVATHTDDATEGLTAFAEKRPPKWTHQ
ncbi:MAG TPA: enoyl-CoA hydratase/isomerase family protein [Acidimicrobiia bacterium]|nr:enoyl-CoA hydratase/isomerase family protein [Acidimicrobiia bacterium]